MNVATSDEVTSGNKFSMQQQQNRQRKQKYLREEILEQGYDAEEFVDYLNNVLKVGADVDAMTLRELQDVVEGFKNRKQGESMQSAEVRSSKHSIEDRPLAQNYEIMTSQQEEKPAKPRTILYEKYGNVQQEEIDKTIKCLKFTSKTPPMLNPRIEVSDPQRKTAGGLFGIGGVSFLLFKINTHEMKWEVRRRYSDFQWLRQIIAKFFPTYIVPPIPRKNAKKRTQRDLDKRMRILTYFLNDLAGIPEIFQSRYVTGFLNLTNESQFEQLKKDANKKQAFQTITSLETASGTVRVRLNPETKAFMEESEKFMAGAEVLYKDITRGSKLLQNLYIDETNTLYQMGNYFADLHLLLKDFNNRLPSYRQPVLNDTYITLNNMMVEWGNIVRNQHAYLEKNFNTFFKYIRNEIMSMRELHRRATELQAEYFKNRVALDRKKEKIFQNGDHSRWEVPQQELSSIPSAMLSNRTEAMRIMLPRQSFEVEKQRMKFAFYQSQFAEQATIVLGKGTTRYCQNFKEFAIKIKVNNQQLTELWTEIATNFADPRKKISVQQFIEKKDEELEDG